MFKSGQYIKAIITVSFIALISLCILGIALIYSELVEFSKISSAPTEENKELILISNTLASLYKAESAGNMLVAETMPLARTQYDSLMSCVYRQVDSLKKISKDPLLNLHLDSAAILLKQKERNTNQMFLLLDSVNQRIVFPVSKTTVLSKRDLNYLDNMLQRSIQKQEDTVKIETEKKKFFDRVRAVFTSKPDSQVVISKNTIQTVDTVELSFPTVTDTIVQYVNERIVDYTRRNSVVVQQLMRRQVMMHTMNEKLTVQINKILRDIEFREYQRTIQLLKEREHLLTRSANIAYVVSLAALILTIIFLILILRSISHSQAYRKKLEESKRYAENLLDARERLIFSLTHDIKSPISSIIGYIELMSKSKLPQREKYYIENMSNSAEHVLRLVKNLLDYHTLDSERQQIKLMSFSPYILLNNICQSFLPLAEKKNISLNFECKIPKGDYFESDPYRLRQIVDNLISNAIKFTPSKGKISLSVSLEDAINGKKNNKLKIEVTDTGCGIEKEKQAIIFEEFRRVGDEEVEGSGLGLAITQKLVHLLKGTIAVQSEYGTGSRFTVILPVTLSANKDESQARSARKLIHAISDRKILFIDDDAVQLNLFSEQLKSYGFIPSVCNKSLDALALIQKTKYDIIFSDIQMPDMNGFELVERIRMGQFENAKTVPVIALSASSNIPEQKYIEAGFSGFLEKPFSLDKVLNIIEQYIGKSVLMSEEQGDEEIGFNALIHFATDDVEAAQNIIRSFIEENEKNTNQLRQAVKEDNWNTVKNVAHKMLPLVRMVTSGEIIALLVAFDRENLQDKDKVKELISLVNQLLEDAKIFLAKL